MATRKSNILHNLDNGYLITGVAGNDCRVLLRNQYYEPLVILELCNDKVSNVRGYKKVVYADKYRPILTDFVRQYHYHLTSEAAIDLGLSIIKEEGQEEVYYTDKELTPKILNRYFKGEKSVSITFNSFKRHKFVIPVSVKNCTFNFTHADISKLVISDRCNLSLDLRDNQYISTLIIEDNFIGNLNLSRSRLTDFRVGDNCRADVLFNYSGKCFNIKIGDVYSGKLDIKNSCFHNMEIGYYCYADIQLSENWGYRNIDIGDSFRGTLNADSVFIKNISIGDDCKGKVFVSSKNSHYGTSQIEFADEFDGELDITKSQTVKFVDIGKNSHAQLKMLGCPSIEAVRVADNFSGLGDFRESGLMYLKAHNGCKGHFIMLHCDNLSLLELPNNRMSHLEFEKSPIDVNVDEHNIYYKFNDTDIPEEYRRPKHLGWLQKTKNFFRNHFLSN